MVIFRFQVHFWGVNLSAKFSGWDTNVGPYRDRKSMCMALLAGEILDINWIIWPAWVQTNNIVSSPLRLEPFTWIFSLVIISLVILSRFTTTTPTGDVRSPEPKSHRGCVPGKEVLCQTGVGTSHIASKQVVNVGELPSSYSKWSLGCKWGPK